MFDNNIYIEGTCKNISKDGEVTGFELQTHIPYYRGIPLSMVNDVLVKAQGCQIERSTIHCSLDQKQWFTLDEMPTVTTYKWEYGEPLYIHVVKSGGLEVGENTVELTVSVRTAYIPVPLVGVKAFTQVIR
ncbi:C-glycoside deglycosidase beta subunit domain-containing protein [Vibrio spartinae]|uniref:C-deglycosylation enzyme beta subunit n=1 Tax=Vibrio spartinae TaxID=1918945 RepID=A0A1N6MAU2_9VIBR|nr:DUF6379 domain-containing protein [Vibrio spartinae]QMV13788.1 hypothetical protein Vspart_01030 [Vibrio spartinae]SIO96572.1 hypothetical protein VSP9026_04375 [Vibrio spartinae]